MKNLLLAGIVSLATFVACSPASQAAESPGCQSADMTKSKADVGSAQHGGRAILLAGPEAAGFLDYLNTKIGDQTEFKGDALIIGFYPDLHYVLIGFVLNGCADQRNLVKLDPVSFLRAYKAARGVEA